MNRNLALLGRQLLGIWKQLGLNQRISIVLAASVVAVALFSLAFWSSRVDYALLYGKLDDAEAAKDAAAWVRRVRRRAGLSQAEFARRIGLSVVTVRGWEQGKLAPQGAARALLRVIDRVPEAVLALSAS